MPTVSPNMGLTIPTVSQTPGPEWASNINSSLSLVDSHDHSSGRGVPVTPAGMSISSALTFQGNAATDVSRLGLSQLGATLGVTILRSVYSVGSSGDLYYNNGTGTPVQITNGASLAGAAGTISGLPFGTASASFASDTFTWQQATGIGAIMDSGPLKVRRAAASANYIQIQPPAVMAANWNLTLPPSAPASQAVMTVSSAGVATHATVDSTLTLTASLLKVNQIQTGNIATSAVTTAKINNGAVDRTKLAAVGQVISTESGTQNITSGTFVPVPNAVSGYVSCTLNVATTRPIMVFLQSSGTNTAYISPPSNGSALAVEVQYPGGGTVMLGQIEIASSGSGGQFPPSSVSVMVLPTSWGGAGTFTFTLLAHSQTAGQLTIIDGCELVAYQL